ncbi:DUF1566 domain-containing protein [Parabacteroides sp. ZJ-118]|uniref:DUF1566 domain-containing protein n=1 Tax=Parabacteroides sp. ZJ-118 TaxID=2709398 RepID=UPI0013EE363B|nr:DUF1566 domain-containing protein [Parabacteroides sp. ZJ-118]
MKKKMHFVLTALLVSFIFNSCSSDSPEENLPEKEEPEVPSEKYENDVVNPDYVHIDWEKTKLYEVDQENGRYSFEASSETKNLKPGSILIIDADTASYIVIVNELRRDNGEISIETRKGDLCDIFANTEFTLSTGGESTRSPNKNVILPQKISFLDMDGEWKEYNFMNSRTPSHLTGNLWKWNNDELEGRILYEHPKFKIYLEKSNFHIDIDLNMTLSFGGRTLQEVKDVIKKQYRSKALSVEANIEGRFETNQQLRFDAWHQYTYDNDERIKELSKYLPKIKVRFLVLGVPVEVSLNADVYRAISLSSNGKISAYMGFTDKASGTIGFQWNQVDDKLTPVNELKNELSVTYPTMKGKGDMNGKVWLYPRIRVVLYGLLGPSFDVKPYVRMSVHGGFYEELLSSSKDFCAWDLSNHVGLDARAGLSFMFIGQEVKNVSTSDINIFDKCIYHSPYDIRYVSSTSKSVKKNVPNTVKFEVYDADSIFNRSIPTILSQIVKFEGKGELSSKYGIANHGQVSVEWIPTSFKDTLYARLYDVDGKIMKEAKFYGNTQINVMTGNASVEKTDVVCFGKLEGMDNFSEVEYGIKINENHIISHNINNSIYSVELSDLSEGTYNYCAYAKFGTEISYGDIKTFVIEVDNEEPTPGQAVDLGLSVKWASWNVGANKPEEFGSHYAWGETGEKSVYDFNTYSHWQDLDGSGDRLLPNCSGDCMNFEELVNIGNNISGTNYDVAHVRWGGKWRMPTRNECMELITKCKEKWVEYHGVGGLLITGPNGNSIFLPAVGYKGEDIIGVAPKAWYWTASIHNSLFYDAYYLGFSNDNYGTMVNGAFRWNGAVIRPVCD